MAADALNRHGRTFFRFFLSALVMGAADMAASVSERSIIGMQGFLFLMYFCAVCEIICFCVSFSCCVVYKFILRHFRVFIRYLVPFRFRLWLLWREQGYCVCDFACRLKAVRFDIKVDKSRHDPGLESAENGSRAKELRGCADGGQKSVGHRVNDLDC